MTNQLEATTDWINASQRLENVNNRLELYPNDAKLIQEKKILEDQIQEFENVRRGYF